MRSQHGMDGVSEFMRHCRHITRASLKVQQNIRSVFRVYRSAECTVAFALTDFAVHVLLFKDALRHFCDLRVEVFERVEDHLCRIVVIEFFVRFGDGRINIITAEFIHAEQFGFELEEAMEYLPIQLSGGDFELSIVRTERSARCINSAGEQRAPAKVQVFFRNAQITDTKKLNVIIYALERS